MWQRGLGPVDWPPPLRFLVLTDREDEETEWFVTYDPDGYIEITDTLPDAHDGMILRYGPYEGPFIDGAEPVMLLIRDGRLGYEWLGGTEYVRDYGSTRPVAVIDGDRTIAIIHGDDWVGPGDILGYREEETVA